MTGRFIERGIEMCSSWAAIGLGKFVKQQRCRSEEEWGGNKSEARGIVLKAIEKALDFMLSGLESPRRIVSRGGTWSNHTHTLTHAHTQDFQYSCFQPTKICWQPMLSMGHHLGRSLLPCVPSNLLRVSSYRQSGTKGRVKGRLITTIHAHL